MADSMLEMVKKLDPGFELNYTRFYIGLAKNGSPDNFVVFRAKKTFLRFEPRLDRSDETQKQLESAGLDVMDYDERWGRYRIRLTPEDLKKNREVLDQIVAAAFKAAGGTG